MRTLGPTLGAKAKKINPKSPVPVREQTVQFLRDAILSFELKPGERLVEREFIARLGISRTTFREALRQLSTEGLVTSVAQKGARVASPSYKEAADLYEIRAALEALMVRKFIERASDEEIAALTRALEEFEKVVSETTDTVQLLNATAYYYRVLMDGARSIVLEQVLLSVRSRAQAFRSRSLSIPGRAAQVAKELRGVLEAIVERDADTAAKRCAEHVLIAGEVALAGLSQSQIDSLSPLSM
jgi:DNA-binding GntR family transcriptional regulator